MSGVEGARATSIAAPNALILFGAALHLWMADKYDLFYANQVLVGEIAAIAAVIGIGWLSLRRQGHQS